MSLRSWLQLNLHCCCHHDHGCGRGHHHHSSIGPIVISVCLCPACPHQGPNLRPRWSSQQSCRTQSTDGCEVPFMWKELKCTTSLFSWHSEHSESWSTQQRSPINPVHSGPQVPCWCAHQRRGWQTWPALNICYKEQCYVLAGTHSSTWAKVSVGSKVQRFNGIDGSEEASTAKYGQRVRGIQWIARVRQRQS